MTLSVPITPDIEAKLRERASCEGMAPEAYAAEVIARAVSCPTLDEILAPIHDDFAKTGMSEEEIMDVGRNELEALRAAKNAKSA